jgi:hypothetical protein
VDPIEHFLFTTKEGHCELAATAFVLMCRTQGIPARLVNGFQTGEWNELYGYYAVRQAEAHAWAEVLFAGEAGWIDFDPTPWIGAEGSAMSALEKVQDYLRMRWLNYVISYTLSDQLSVAERVRARLQRLREEIGKTVRDLRRALPRLPPKELARLVMAAAGVLAVAVGLGYWLVARRRNGKKKLAALQRRARPVPFFEEMLRLLERRGLRRLPTETAREFAARVAREAKLAEPARVAEAFYRVRFGEEELPPADRAEVEAALAAIGGKALSSGSARKF